MLILLLFFSYPTSDTDNSQIIEFLGGKFLFHYMFWLYPYEKAKKGFPFLRLWLDCFNSEKILNREWLYPNPNC